MHSNRYRAHYLNESHDINRNERLGITNLCSKQLRCRSPILALQLVSLNIQLTTGGRHEICNLQLVCCLKINVLHKPPIIFDNGCIIIIIINPRWCPWQYWCYCIRCQWMEWCNDSKVNLLASLPHKVYNVNWHSLASRND